MTAGFDYATATPAEVRAEAARRDDLRRRGLPIAPRAPPLSMIEQQVVTKTVAASIVADPGARWLTLPWSALLGDNAKYAPALQRNRSARPPVSRAVIILTSEYRKAKQKARDSIERQLAGLPPLEGPCSLLACMFEPDRRTRRDITNYAKLVHDALTGLAYVDDSQLDDVRWIRAGVDIDAPRLDLTITALAPGRAHP